MTEILEYRIIKLEYFAFNLKSRTKKNYNILLNS